jgi:hypothetical protein
MKWTKIIISCCIIFIIACRKVEVRPETKPITTNVFSNVQNTIDNGQEIQFDLTKNGVYTLTIGDSTTNQVLTRERFNGQIGINKKKIYTKSLSVKYLYLLLEDENKSKVGKTIIIVK